MRQATGDGAWDLTSVISLLYSLSPGESDRTIKDPLIPQCGEQFATPELQPDDYFESHLGNFDKIWTYLGQPLKVPPPSIPSDPEDSVTKATGDDCSVGSATGKGVRWRDEVDGADLEDNDTFGNGFTAAKLNQHGRKKDRKQVRLARQDQERERLGRHKSTKVPESDSEIQTPQPVPNRRAIIQQILSRPLGTKINNTTTNSSFLTATPTPKGSIGTNDQRSLRIPKLLLVPSTPSNRIVASQKEQELQIAALRKQQLMTMLHDSFVDDRQYLRSISVAHHEVESHDKTTVEGIHVFIDASNIMIGFHDALKLSRGLSLTTRIRRQPLSFHNLSLILERGRPAAKRVLVGSDNFPAIQEAKLIGYETNILDRVHKAKELTPRQKKYNLRGNSNGNNNGNGNGSGTSGQSSGSETTIAATRFAPEKWVEQAVDEILHLKILESVVDADEPSTIVLATGDAAEAEYSGGFLKMVERALAKGWRVELVSFRHNTSGAYKRKDFRTKWGERFKIIELDDFAELLLGG